MIDPLVDHIGDYRAFTGMQRDRLAARGIDIAPHEWSHLAVRVREWDQYVHLSTGPRSRLCDIPLGCSTRPPSGVPRAAMSPPASGGRIVKAVSEEDF